MNNTTNPIFVNAILAAMISLYGNPVIAMTIAPSVSNQPEIFTTD
jgi:hypothetical protein